MSIKLFETLQKLDWFEVVRDQSGGLQHAQNYAPNRFPVEFYQYFSLVAEQDDVQFNQRPRTA